jgi:hypothetical protein
MKRGWGQNLGAPFGRARLLLLAPLAVMLALLAWAVPAAAQPLVKSAINVNAGNTKPVNQSFGYRLTYSCESSSGPCLNAEVTDLLPAEVQFLSTVPAAPTGDIAAINVTPNFGGSGRTRVQFVMISPLTAGNSGDLVVNVRFPTGTAPGTVATNTADAINLGTLPGTFTTPPVTVTSLGVGTTTTVTSSLNPSQFGQAVTFTATVTGSGGTPTGSVTFRDGATTLGTVVLNGSGVATLTTSSLSAGSHAIAADYGGDATFANSSGTVAGGQIVNQTTAATSLTSSLNPSQFGQSVTFTATVTGSGGTPTGAVTFKDGATNLATVPLNGSGTATLTTSALSVGTHAMTVDYSGDANFAAGTGTLAGGQVVNSGSPGTTLSSSLNPSQFGQAVTFTATVTGSGGTPTGTVTFKDGATNLGTVALNGSGTATFTTSALSVGTHAMTADYSGDANFAAGTGTLAGGQVVNPAGSSTTLASSLNPSVFGQAVTFTATVTASGGTPTGAVTFRDGAAVLGTVTLNGAGVATFTTASLAVGSHSITAAYGGDANFSASTSSALLQTVNVPADSARLRALQIAVTRIEADGAGQIISGAINAAIADGFSSSNIPITPSEGGMRFNFSADLEQKQTEERRASTQARVGDAFASLGHAPGTRSFKAPPLPPQQKDWLAWGEIRGIGWNTNLQTGDIRGSQTHALLGLTRKFSPDFLVGVFGGYETFNYSSQLLSGRLKGDGWTVGGYAGWKLLPGLRLDAGVARSGIGYDGIAGTAAGTFTGQRWLVTGGLTGIYKGRGFEIEPSARVYGLWEHEDAYLDSLGIQQAQRNFSSGRASAGSKLTVPFAASGSVSVAPYMGIYADYYFSRDDATLPNSPLLLPTEFIHGWSGRVTSGIGVTVSGGPTFTLGGEVGGLASGQFTNWSVRGRAALPF